MLLIIMVISFCHTTLSEYQIMITYGVPITYSDYSNLSLSWDDCVDACSSNSSCIVVYEEDCQMFSIGQISKVERLTSGTKVAFRLYQNTTLTCPAEDTLVESPFLSYSDPYWTLPTCPENFTLFVRDEGFWCMQMATSETCLYRNESITACAENYGGVLSGIENLEEFNFLAARAIELNKEITDGYAVYFFWVNGDRKSTCMPPTVQSASCNGTNEFTFSDPTLSSDPQGYVWLSTQPDGLTHPTTPPADCLSLKYEDSTSSCGIDDCSCAASSKTGTSGYCFKGYACGLQLQLF
uniref:CW domain-containing protein n=1 Tax=Caenorhabditis japonica TaxID=281687 RepID=A0A8R1I1V6_CAEJA